MNILSPSMLAADFAKLGDELDAIKNGGAQYLHIDVMDGKFVPSISFGMPVIKSIRKKSDLIFDVHLMIEQPERYIKEFAASGADIITVHAEASVHLDRTLTAIREAGCKAGIALNPSTPLNVLEYVFDKVDMVLIMTVNPGYGGQKYLPAMTQKIRDLRAMIQNRNLDVNIEVDGGINLNNVQMVLDAGANVIVAGSAVFGPATEQAACAFMEILSAEK